MIVVGHQHSTVLSFLIPEQWFYCSSGSFIKTTIILKNNSVEITFPTGMTIILHTKGIHSISSVTMLATNTAHIVRFEAIPALTMKITVFWDVTHCGQHFRGTPLPASSWKMSKAL
jgi:hypothetical protein